MPINEAKKESKPDAAVAPSSSPAQQCSDQERQVQTPVFVAFRMFESRKNDVFASLHMLTPCQTFGQRIYVLLQAIHTSRTGKFMQFL
jgi:hypothetical protein